MFPFFESALNAHISKILADFIVLLIDVLYSCFSFLINFIPLLIYFGARNALPRGKFNVRRQNIVLKIIWNFHCFTKNNLRNRVRCSSSLIFHQVMLYSFHSHLFIVNQCKVLIDIIQQIQTSYYFSLPWTSIVNIIFSSSSRFRGFSP